jgi:hypothetical protein
LNFIFLFILFICASVDVDVVYAFHVAVGVVVDGRRAAGQAREGEPRYDEGDLAGDEGPGHGGALPQVPAQEQNQHVSQFHISYTWD